jgi:hypothetical protein
MSGRTPVAGPPAVGRRRFLRRAGTVLGVGLGITMTATPAWAPPSCVTKCTRIAPCWACSGFTFFECRCSGGITMTATPAWAPPGGTCVTKCTKAATCWLCGGYTMYKCSCAGGTPYYTCLNKCSDSFCRSYSGCV